MKHLSVLAMAVALASCGGGGGGGTPDVSRVATDAPDEPIMETDPIVSTPTALQIARASVLPANLEGRVPPEVTDILDVNLGIIEDLTSTTILGTLNTPTDRSYMNSSAGQRRYISVSNRSYNSAEPIYTIGVTPVPAGMSNVVVDMLNDNGRSDDWTVAETRTINTDLCATHVYQGYFEEDTRNNTIVSYTTTSSDTYGADCNIVPPTDTRFARFSVGMLDNYPSVINAEEFVLAVEAVSTGSNRNQLVHTIELVEFGTNAIEFTRHWDFGGTRGAQSVTYRMTR